MYTKDLNETVRLRLSDEDMAFLRSLSDQRNVTISSCVRSIIGEYRRSFQTLELLKNTFTEIGAVQNGDTSTNIDNIL